MMDRRRFLAGAPAAAAVSALAPAAPVAAQRRPPRSGKKGVLLLNRIGPTSSDLFIANADGSNERRVLANPFFEYNASFGADGQSIVFTSERNGRGQSDVFRARIDGTGITQLASGPAVEDAAVLSPDGARLAFVSTREGYRANIWVQDLRSGRARNLTGAADVQGDPASPNSFLRPAWSPDGRWLAFSSDRHTDWRGHSEGRGWEHTQELSIYVIGVDGRGFRRVASKPGFCLGSPKWSPDGRRIVFYEMTVEHTWNARRPNLVGSAVSQIVSVDIATGERMEHTKGPGLKVFPQYLGASEIAYHRKGGQDEGLYYTSLAGHAAAGPDGSERPAFKAALRSPSWSHDGKLVIYEKVDFKAHAQNTQLYSWDPEWDYRYTDVFPVLARDGTLLITEKHQNSSLAIMKPDGSGRTRIFDTEKAGINVMKARMGMAGAFNPAWSPDSQWIAFGLGGWFQDRRTETARVMRVKRDGTGIEALTDGSIHSGFPSYSADGREIVYRVWSEKETGLRVLDLETRQTRVLTQGYDNLPAWSPDGRRILFTRRVDNINFDIFTIRPDGTDLLRLTSHRAIDGHAVWSADGRILWNSGIYGFRDEAALYDNTFQQYGQIFVMNADGSGKRMLTDSRWEDAMPCYLPAKFL